MSDFEKKRRGYLIVKWMAVVLVVFEGIGGVTSGSMMILADAGHILGDIVVYHYCAKAMLDALSEEAGLATAGNRNFNIIIGVTMVNMVLAVLRTQFLDHTQVAPESMLTVSAIGLFVNLIMAGILIGLKLSHGHECTHDHNHNHEEHGRTDWINYGAVLHILGDIGISIFGVGVAVGLVFWSFQSPEIVDSGATLVAGSIIIFFAVRGKRKMNRQ